MQQKMTEVTNLENQNGTLADALKGADIFGRRLRTDIVTPEMGCLHEPRFHPVRHGQPGT